MIDKIVHKWPTTCRFNIIKKQINEFEGRLKQAERSITCVNQKTCHVNDCLNKGLESLENRIQYLESLEDQDDNEEEERDKEIERVEQAAENMVQTVIKNSLEILIDMEKDVQKL